MKIFYINSYYSENDGGYDDEDTVIDGFFKIVYADEIEACKIRHYIRITHEKLQKEYSKLPYTRDVNMQDILEVLKKEHKILHYGVFNADVFDCSNGTFMR